MAGGDHVKIFGNINLFLPCQDGKFENLLGAIHTPGENIGFYPQVNQRNEM